MDGGAAAGQSAAVAATVTAPRPTTKFTRTCSLLRQFIKEKGALGIDIQMTAPPASAPATGAPPPWQRRESERAGIFPRDAAAVKGQGAHPAAPVLLPDLNGSGVAAPPPPPQLTIFYGGRVFVFDNFPQDKARQFMAAAAAARGVASSPSAPVAPASTNTYNPSAAAGTAPVSCAVAAGSEIRNAVAAAAVTAAAITGHDAQRPPNHQPILASGSDLPIARRVSLNRFLEKRKDRISSKAPYQVAGSPDPMPSKPPPQQPSSSRTSGSPSPSLGGGDPSAGPSSSKPFLPAADQAASSRPHGHSPLQMPDKTVELTQLPAPAACDGDDDGEEPPSTLPWLGLAPPPSNPPPPRAGK